MQQLEQPDSFYLSAAQGWLELVKHIEANAELENISAPLRAHPDVLGVKWEIYAKAGGWEACRDIATLLIQLVPDRPQAGSIWRMPSTGLKEAAYRQGWRF